MTSLAGLRPGDIGFGSIAGPAKLLVDAGQLMLGEGFRVGRLNIEHVFVVTEQVSIELGESRYPMCVEAMPSGAREWSMRDRWTPEYAYVRLPEDYPGQAQDAAAIARAMIGTPYSFASYAALAAWKFGLKTPRLEKWIDRRKSQQAIPGLGLKGTDGTVTIDFGRRLPAEAICSVLADQAWSLTGKKIMQGVAHQCVTPGALAMRLLEMTSEGAQWIWPSSI